MSFHFFRIFSYVTPHLLFKDKKILSNFQNFAILGKDPTLQSSTLCSLSPSNKRPDWNRAVSEAEKIVGYPTSFLNLRLLLGDEVANVALYLKKLIGSNHPLLKTAKTLIFNGRNIMQTWGLIVLLISKAAGLKNVDDMVKDNADGVLYRQKTLAEITEMIRTSHLVHKGLVNIYAEQYQETSEVNDMAFGNQIALLGGVLLSSAFAGLAALRNNDILDLMSRGMRDQAISECLGQRDKQNNPLPSCRDGALADWTLRNVLSAGSLLGNSCQGSLKLAGHTTHVQEQGYKFGKHLALAWQACLELEPFIGNKYVPGSVFNLTSAPVLFHLEKDPSLYSEIEKGLDTILAVDYKKVHETVSKGPGIELTKELHREHSQKAMEVLNNFQDSDARTALSNIVFVMGELTEQVLIDTSVPKLNNLFSPY